jgi:hypothetical protein
MDAITQDIGFDDLAGIQLSDFSGQSQEMAEIVGIPVVIKIVEHFGGTMGLYIPQSISEENVLAKLIGALALSRLIEWRGGEVIDVNREANVLRMIRDKKIVTLKQRGLSVPALARKFNMTERGVYKVLRRWKELSTCPV